VAKRSLAETAQSKTLAGYPIYPMVTLEGLVRHHEVYGFDTEKTYKGPQEKTYKRYASLRSDALVYIGRLFLRRDEYRKLIVRLGFSQFADQSTVDWVESQPADQGV